MTPAEVRAAANEIVAALVRVPPHRKLAELKKLISGLPNADVRNAVETLVLTTEGLVNQRSSRSDRNGVLIFGVAFLVVLLVIALAVPNPTASQLLIFRVVLALAAAGVAWFIPGFIDVNVRLPRIAIRASGAIAVFVIVYLVNPPNVVR